MEKLEYRLNILKSSNVIDDEIYEKLIKLLNYLRNDWNIILTEDNGSMLITHLSMALKRIKEGENVNKIDEEVYNDALKSDKLEEVKKIYNGIVENVFIEDLPEEEKKYIYVNLLLIKENLYRKVEGGILWKL